MKLCLIKKVQTERPPTSLQKDVKNLALNDLGDSCNFILYNDVFTILLQFISTHKRVLRVTTLLPISAAINCSSASPRGYSIVTNDLVRKLDLYYNFKTYSTPHSIINETKSRRRTAKHKQPFVMIVLCRIYGPFPLPTDIQYRSLPIKLFQYTAHLKRFLVMAPCRRF